MIVAIDAGWELGDPTLVENIAVCDVANVYTLSVPVRLTRRRGRWIDHSSFWDYAGGAQ